MSGKSEKRLLASSCLSLYLLACLYARDNPALTGRFYMKYDLMILMCDITIVLGQ